MSRANEFVAPVCTETCEREGSSYRYYSPGLTIREHFAAMAMQGILAGCHPITKQAGAEALVSDAAVGMADALIQELGKAHG